MRILSAMLISSFVAASPQTNNVPERAATPVSDALGWYSVWFVMEKNTPAGQTCRGELRAGLYSFRCDPLAVVVSARVEDSGRCSIVNMRPSVSPEDGLRVNTLSNLVPQRKASVPRPSECSELPTTEGPLQITITPQLREIDDHLTKSARAAALAFIRMGGDSRCTLDFPKVRIGDPFFHVYSECEGVLDNVMEFVITPERVADYPHWTYDRARKDLPPGTGQRLKKPNLWSGVSRPDERK